MPTHERSTFGCWTCRVRKKKCDERVPICVSCELRGITCYGYGTKPAWMDGGANEKKILTELQHTVRESLRKKRSYLPDPSPIAASSAAISDAGTDPSLPTISGSRSFPSNPSSLPTPPPSIASVASRDPTPYSMISAYSSRVEHSASLPSPPEDTDIDVDVEANATRLHAYPTEIESNLLMNFLDRVFPLLFRCYTPPCPELGRGWLLALLTRTKPLYHTALALSALHMHSILLSSNRTRCIKGQWDSMKRHHTLAFRELQVQISRLGSDATHIIKETIETLACIVQLITFELLRGGADSWQIHLQAGSKLMPTLVDYIEALYIETPSRPRLTAYKDVLNGPDFPPAVDEVASDFLISTLIWYDIIASASSHSVPYMQPYYNYITTNELSNIMGCESWVMILIARISALRTWKRQNPHDIENIDAQSTEIEHSLREGLLINDREMRRPQNHPENEQCQKLGVSSTKVIGLITRVFALSALTFLHTVIEGPRPDNLKIRESVRETLMVMGYAEPTLMRNLVWPFTVTGCMTEDEEGQREFVKSLVEEERMGRVPGNLWKAWEVVQECWRLRATGVSMDWGCTMANLGWEILLV